MFQRSPVFSSYKKEGDLVCKYCNQIINTSWTCNVTIFAIGLVTWFAMQYLLMDDATINIRRKSMILSNKERIICNLFFFKEKKEPEDIWHDISLLPKSYIYPKLRIKIEMKYNTTLYKLLNFECKYWNFTWSMKKKEIYYHTIWILNWMVYCMFSRKRKICFSSNVNESKHWLQGDQVSSGPSYIHRHISHRFKTY